MEDTNETKEEYVILTQEELDDIFLENFSK